MPCISTIIGKPSLKDVLAHTLPDSGAWAIKEDADLADAKRFLADYEAEKAAHPNWQPSPATRARQRDAEALVAKHTKDQTAAEKLIEQLGSLGY